MGLGVGMGVGFGVGYGVWFPPPANVTDETRYSRAKVTLARFIVSLLQLLVEIPIVLGAGFMNLMRTSTMIYGHT